MAIRFVNKPKKSEPAPAKQQVEPAQPATPAKSGKGFSLQSKTAPAEDPGDLQGFKILPTMDFTVKEEESKFLVHKTKPGVWYEVVSYDEYATTPVLKLRSPGGLTFDSTRDITTDKKYAMVVGPGDVPAPPEAVLKKVRFSSESS